MTFPWCDERRRAVDHPIEDASPVPPDRLQALRQTWRHRAAAGSARHSRRRRAEKLASATLIGRQTSPRQRQRVTTWDGSRMNGQPCVDSAPSAAGRRPSSTGRWRRRGGGRSPWPAGASSRDIAQGSPQERPTKLTIRAPSRNMVERGELAVVGAVVEPHARRSCRRCGRERRRDPPRRAGRARRRLVPSGKRMATSADGEQIGRQPHVGISRSEHDPRQQHEDQRQEDRRGRQIARIGQAPAHQGAEQDRRRRGRASRCRKSPSGRAAPSSASPACAPS